eukprot:scaffold5049_cov162-Alexandrium_tamarense.AAC.8
MQYVMSLGWPSENQRVPHCRYLLKTPLERALKSASWIKVVYNGITRQFQCNTVTLKCSARARKPTRGEESLEEASAAMEDNATTDLSNNVLLQV